MIITNLQERSLVDHDRERRRHPRKEASLPVFLNRMDSNEKAFHKGVIQDLSIGGARLSIPKAKTGGIMEEMVSDKLEMNFVLPEEGGNIHFRCRTSWMKDTQDQIKLGAYFVDGDFGSCKGLLDYLKN
jgi:hypothetical protein